MRTIKFRAYIQNPENELHGLLLPVEEIEWDILGEELINLVFAYHGRHWEVKSDDVELMQFTGLKDKDGVEIYEGDIISYDWIYNDPDWTYGAGNEPKEVVRWNDKRTGYSPITDQDQFYTIKNIQIQGNIYQNPELLEDTP